MIDNRMKNNTTFTISLTIASIAALAFILWGLPQLGVYNRTLAGKAALMEPEPEGLTDEELEEEFGRALLNLPGDSMNATAVAFARAVLARWGK